MTTSPAPAPSSTGNDPYYLAFAFFAALAGLVLLVWLAGLAAAAAAGSTGDFDDALAFVVFLATSADAAASWQRATGQPPLEAGVFWGLLTLLLTVTGAAVYLAASALREHLAQRGNRGAAWATPKHEQRITVPEDPAERPGRIVAGRSMRTRSLLAGDDCISATVFGPNGSGKTLGLIIPNVLEWNGPCVVSTAKGPDLKWIIKARRKHGPVWVVAPEGLSFMRPARWSPTTYATDEEAADRMARWLCDASAITDDPRARPWVLKARSLVGPVLMAAQLSGGGVDKFYRWCLDGQDSRRDVRSILMEHGYEQMADNYEATWRLHPDGVGSVLFTAAAVVDAYARPRIRDSATTSDFTAEQLLREKGTVCIVAPPSQADALAPMFTALVASIVHEAEQTYERTGPLQPRLLLALDEAGNVFRYSGLPTLLTTARGMGIQLITVWHDLAQLQTRYGNDSARTILSQSKLRLLLPGMGDMSTLQYFSQMIGNEVAERPSHSTGNDGRFGVSTQPQKDELAPVHLLQQLPEWHAVMQYANLPPMRVRMRTCFGEPALKALAKGETP
ncbi:type IV secretory system conjugative DNA transfer family protein [Planomonospora sp. ID91781]|uniref:type IV secretory system conjugative DNA transfer family protein n=1 Tax=Planomonospora sp. ID91781 TaxID=2738135 RepID=UPI0018C36321|nr:type IV secretory system conjugative DNA transfer family protein [Planomonospora sp. ID91781]MBG0825822.1 type IV secretory system conjugative DNA transfer family protein [Planomonospora sp. ID91781]